MSTSSHDSGVHRTVDAQPDADRLPRFEMRPLPIGSEPPRALVGDARPVDHRDAETWRPAGVEAILTGDAERLALVRWDLADTARAMGLRCVASVIEAAVTREAWEMIAADFASARTLRGSGDDRLLLTASEDAAEHLAAGRIDRAVERLAKSWDSAEEWLNDVRHSRAAKGGA